MYINIVLFQDGLQRFDPTTLKADVVTVELEIGPSVFLLYGTTLRSFLNFKVFCVSNCECFNHSLVVQENIFGEDQNFTDMQQSSLNSDGQELKEDNSLSNLPLELQEDFDHRTYRPLEVDVSVIMHDVQVHLLKVNAQDTFRTGTPTRRHFNCNYQC